MGKGLSASRDELMMWAIRKGLDFSEDRDKIEKERQVMVDELNRVKA